MKRDPNMFQMKEGLINMENGARANKKEFIEQQIKLTKEFGTYLGMAQGCFKCLPMHISKNRDVIYKQNAKDREEFEKYY